MTNVMVSYSLKVVQFWDITKVKIISDAELIDVACSHLIRNFDRAQWSAFLERNHTGLYVLIWQPLNESIALGLIHKYY